MSFIPGAYPGNNIDWDKRLLKVAIYLPHNTAPSHLAVTVDGHWWDSISPDEQREFLHERVMKEVVPKIEIRW